MPKAAGPDCPAAHLDAKASLRNADGGADLVRRAISENVVAINRTPFVTPWWCAQMVLVVIDFIATIPVFVFDGCTFLPFFVFDVRVVVLMVVGEGDATHKARRKDCERLKQYANFSLVFVLE
jgi:hypothetical protein